MFIQDSQQLKEVCTAIKNQEFVVLDTEFIRIKTYYPILCLIQIATPDYIFAVDMLSDIDFSPLAEVLSNDAVCKIIHSPRQDLEVIYHKFGFIMKNVFDTQLAAQFLGIGEQIGYEALVKHYLAKQIDKKWQHSNWLQRPLIEDQLEYAMLDVSLLMEVYPKLVNDLKRKNRYQWALEENCNRYDDIKDFNSSTEDLLRKFSSHFREQKQFMSALVLIELREEKAQKSDLTRNRIIEDEEIVSIVRSNHMHERYFKKLGVVPESINIFNSKPSTTELEIIDRVLAERDMQFQNKNFVFELLKILLKKIAEDTHLAPTLIATTSDLLKISSGVFGKKFTAGWRNEVFTETIKAFLSNQKGLFCNGKTIELR